MPRLHTVSLLMLIVLLVASCGGAPEEPAVRAPAAATEAPTEPTEVLAQAAPSSQTLTNPSSPAGKSNSVAAEGDTWLIMLYANADDEVLEKDIFIDLNEAERIGSSEKVTIVAQFDRYQGAFAGDGDWTGTRRYLITQDDDLTTLNSEVIEDLGEANMADGQTLVDFANWAIGTFPATHHVLILSDHGMGWPGGWNDPDPAEPGPDGLELTSNGDLLLLNEISSALDSIVQETGIGGFEVVGFDACLMGHVEVAAAVAPYARFVVASQEVEPALGWAYASFLGGLADNPGMDASELSASIVESYIEQDQRIVDDEARRILVDETYGYRDATTPAEVVAVMGSDITLSAYDSAALPGALAALDELVVALAALDQGLVAEARTYVQGFKDIFGSKGQSSYIDLGHFAALLKDLQINDEVSAAADGLLAALDEVVIAEKSGPGRPGASGMSIYFPASAIYDSSIAGPEVYATISEQFAASSAWDNYLNFHYFGAPLDDDAFSTENAELSAPGASEITIGEIRLSEERVNQGGSVTLATEVDGEKIGFIYSFTGYYNPDDDTILFADEDFIDAGESQDVGGVFYPNWGDERPIEIEFEWTPVLYGINTGETVEFAFFQAQDYGDTDESATYVVDGIYTFKNGNQRYAELFFKDNELIRVVGYTQQNGGAPREITPIPGHTFTIYEHYIQLNSDDPDAPVEYIDVEGATLTFGDQNWFIEEIPAFAGDYVVGIIAEDLDVNLYESYGTITVDE